MWLGLLAFLVFLTLVAVGGSEHAAMNIVLGFLFLVLGLPTYFVTMLVITLLPSVESLIYPIMLLCFLLYWSLICGLIFAEHWRWKMLGTAIVLLTFFFSVMIIAAAPAGVVTS